MIANPCSRQIGRLGEQIKGCTKLRFGIGGVGKKKPGTRPGLKSLGEDAC